MEKTGHSALPMSQPPELTEELLLEVAVVADFFVDRHEVSNADFGRFVEAGGYRDQRYWRQPFLRDGRKLPWDEAMAELVDATGRPGPAGWELGTFAAGAGELPVTGLSFYEAVAYAEYLRREVGLPTMAVGLILTPSQAEGILRQSQGSGKSDA